MTEQSQKKYEDILYLPYQKSINHPHMSMHDRAAQFAPFAALTGHDLAIQETARLTEQKVELDEEEKELLDVKLRDLLRGEDAQNKVTVLFFQPDANKSGGAYQRMSGLVKKVDPMEETLVFADGRQIKLDRIVALEEENGSY